MMKRIVVAGGGTGGHLFPGIAVIDELRTRLPDLEVLFVGTGRGIEQQVLPKAGHRLEVLDVKPLKGGTTIDRIKSIGGLPVAALRAGALLRREKPDLVLGLGGYVAGPVLAAAYALGIKTALLEQNALVGLTNRMLAPLVGRAYLTFPETAARFRPAAARVVGNPVRQAFVLASQRAAIDPEGFEARAKTILVLGGSQGAKALNETVPVALAQLGALGYRVVHQTGAGMREDVARRYAELGVEAEVTSFIDDMASIVARSAVVIARAGATTVAEICAIGRSSILVPYPFAADDHQTKNADALAREGAALCIAQSELSPNRLANELAVLLGSPTKRAMMAVAARSFGRPHAAEAIADDLCAWLGCPPVSEHSGGRGPVRAVREPNEKKPSESRSTLPGRRPYLARRKAMVRPAAVLRAAS